MDSEILEGFVKQTEEYLPLVRSGILICARTDGAFGELSASVRQIAAIGNSASILGLSEIETACAAFECELKSAVWGAANNRSLDDEDARRLLDRLASLEVLVAEIYFGAEDFSASVSSFVEESFGKFEPRGNSETVEIAVEEAFEIDAEMLEVFALEANELVRNFKRNLELLENSPAAKSAEALSEMRRSAHTLKGSAAVVGLKNLSLFAHRVEDLLDRLAEDEIVGDEKIYESLLAASDCFESLAAGETSPQLTKKIERVCENINSILLKTIKSFSGAERASRDAESENENKNLKSEDNSQAPKSTVRISLEKLDEIVEIAADLKSNRANLEKNFTENGSLENENLASLFARQCDLIEEIQEKLLRLRMVRFGSLAPRFQRTTRVACEEEEKLAELFIDGEDIEIDTQTVDVLVEPLLHLLRNAVAHGVEAPELRRLLGKTETGVIVLRAAVENEQIVVRVSDDGRGISADALRAKAAAANFINARRAEQMSDAEAFELIFLNGLTTAETLRQTAGRGVGMNVVKTNVERRGGTVEIVSEARRGTTFIVRLPTHSSSANSLSVLIVDDSASIRQTVSGLIKDAGWKTQTAENGVEALEILRAAARLPNVILTDAEMPRMDGFGLLNALKSRENLRSIPVVMITSRADEQFRRRAFDSGASEFMTKPFDRAKLIATIKTLFK